MYCIFFATPLFADLLILNFVTVNIIVENTIAMLLFHDLQDNTSIKRVYWQLLFVMVLPHCLTFVRSAVVGVIGKTRKSYPWPSKRALYAVSACIYMVDEVCYSSSSIIIGNTCLSLNLVSYNAPRICPFLT